MITDKTFIFYSLPKSRTTQQLNGGRRVGKAWDNVCVFLNNCTNVRPDQPISISLTVYSACEGDLNPEIADRIIGDTKRIFGPGQREPIAYSYPSGVPTKQTKTEWRLEKCDLNNAVEYLRNGEPWPKFTFGPIELTVSYDFKLVDPTTKEELPNQEEKSRIMIWLSRSCLCSPDLYFPFVQADNEFYNYLKQLDKYLPFKLEEKYLRLGRPSKNKTQYIFTKLKLD